MSRRDDLEIQPEKAIRKKGWIFLSFFNLIYGIPMFWVWVVLMFSFQGFRGDGTSSLEKLYGLSIFLGYYGIWILVNRWIIRKKFYSQGIYWCAALGLHAIFTVYLTLRMGGMF